MKARCGNSQASVVFVVVVFLFFFPFEIVCTKRIHSRVSIDPQLTLDWHLE